MISYGRNREGKYVRADPASLLILGMPGSGKTTTLAYLVRQFRNQGAEVLIGDPHGRNSGGVLAKLHLRPAASAAVDRPGVLELVRRARAELERRRAPDARYRKDLVLVLDELPELVSGEGGEEISETLAELVRSGRKFGVFAILATQSARASEIPPWVAQSMPGALVHRALGPDVYRALGVRLEELPAEPAKLPTGEAVLRVPGGGYVLVRIDPEPEPKKDPRNMRILIAERSRGEGLARNQRFLDALDRLGRASVPDVARLAGIKERAAYRAADVLFRNGIIDRSGSLYHRPEPDPEPVRPAPVSAGLEADLARIEARAQAAGARAEEEALREERAWMAQEMRAAAAPAMDLLRRFLSLPGSEPTGRRQARELAERIGGVVQLAEAQVQTGTAEDLLQLEERLSGLLEVDPLPQWMQAAEEEARRAEEARRLEERRVLVEWARRYLREVGPIFEVSPIQWQLPDESIWALYLEEGRHLPGSRNCRPPDWARGQSWAPCEGCGSAWTRTDAGWRPGVPIQQVTRADLDAALRRVGPDPRTLPAARQLPPGRPAPGLPSHTDGAQPRGWGALVQAFLGPSSAR